MGGELMVRNLAIVCLIYVVLVVQPSVSGELAVGSFRPWLPGIAVVACGLVVDGPASLLWAAFLGLGIDCQSVERPGINLIISTLIASAVIAFRTNDRSHGAIPVALFVFAASLAWRMAASIIHSFIDRQPPAIVNLASSACWDGFSSALLTIAVMIAWRLLINSIRPQSLSSMSLNNRWSMLTEKS